MKIISIHDFPLRAIQIAWAGIFTFGYEWDCDPIIPLSVWVGVLLPIVLIKFIYWAVDMLINIHTPNQFDDPRGKPLTVPTTE